ncbi:MAG: tyrosine-type recombinase/integrase [Sporichthyaceae bacterium]
MNALARAPKAEGRSGRRAGWGTVAKLPSGRYLARWSDADGKRCQAEQTFESVSDARAFLATIKTDILRRTYRAPRQVTERLSEYGLHWIKTRPGIKDSTRHQYEIDFRRHIEPFLGERILDRIEPEAVRKWNATLAKNLRQELAHTGRDGAATVARAYRLLRSILQTAVDDELLVRNPCKISGAGEARSTERPVLRVEEIAALADEVPAHYRAFVIVAAFSGLRAGELAALRLMDLDLGDAPSVRVSRRLYRVAGEVTIDSPKSTRGFRTVPIPGFVADELRQHLAEHRDGAKKADLVFVTGSGRDVLDGYSQVIRRALDRLGREDVRMHDLRHSALTAAAEHGATLATLMHMAGHSTSNAAQRYQHATAEHARKVAAAINASAAALLVRAEPPV